MSGEAARDAEEGPLLRSVLFFPGNRPELLRSATASGADAVCVDLEDGVAPGEKADGRDAVEELLSGASRPGRAAVFVRINDPRTDLGRRDLAALAAPGLRLDGVLIPKAEGPETVRRAGALLADHHPEIRLVPMVETPRGLAGAEEVAEAGERNRALAFGGLDLSAGLGADGSWESLLYARSRIVHAAALARIDVVDAPFMDLGDRSGLLEEARRARRLGFSGKLAVHPDQIEAIHEAYAPASEEVERARRIVEAHEAAGGGVAVVDGRVVDRPVVASARRVLTLARAAGEGEEEE